MWPLRLLLGTGALVALVLALAILFTPTAFYAGYGIAIGGDVALLNELKAPAGAILLAGLVMVAGLSRPTWLGHALLAGTLLYLGFGLGRLVGLIDGLPPASLLAAMAIELAFGLAFAAAFWRRRPR
jgi:hypothetical protein